MLNRLMPGKTKSAHQDVGKTTRQIAKIMGEEGTDKHNLYFAASERAQQEIMTVVQRDLAAAFADSSGSLFKRQAWVQNRGSHIQLLAPPGAAWPIFMACQSVLKDNVAASAGADAAAAPEVPEVPEVPEGAEVGAAATVSAAAVPLSADPAARGGPSLPAQPIGSRPVNLCGSTS